MPLMIAEKNKELTILRVSTDDKTKKHLESLGILQGSTIKIIAESAGNIIVKVKDGRLALNKELARTIMVA